MGFLDDLLRGAQDVAARAYNQANPWDGGKTWNTPVRPAQRPQQRPQPQFSPQVQQQMAAREQALQQSRANIFNPAAIAGDIGRAAQGLGKGIVDMGVNQINATGNMVADFGQAGAEVIREASGMNQADFQRKQQQAAEFRRMAESFAKRAQSEQDPARREAYINQIRSLATAESDLLDQNNQDIARGLAATDPRKTLTNAATGALDVATLGRGTALLKGLQPAATQVTKESLTTLGKNAARTTFEGSGLGAAYGGIETAKDANATLQDYARNMGQGALVGGAVGLGAQVALPVAGAAARATGREAMQLGRDIKTAQTGSTAQRQGGFAKVPTAKDKLLGSKPAQFLYGDKPAVQKATRKLSSFANKTVQGSDEVSAPLKKMVKEEQSSYDTITDSARKQQADDIIKDMDDDTAYTTAVRILEEGNLDTKGQDAVTAIQIAKRLDAKGDETNLMKATEIYNQLSERFSAAGQEVQAAAMLAARSPEGLRYKATKDLKNAGVKVTPEMELELRDKINAVRTTQKQAEQATENARQLTKELQGPRTPDQKIKLEQARSAAREAENKLAQARDNVQYFVAKRIPSETADKVINFWRSGLLTAPTTTAGALVGNIAGTLTRKLWINPTATMTDWALSLGTGKRAHLPAKAGAWGGGMARGGRNIASKQYWETGFDPMNPMATADSMGATSRVINYGDSKAGKITTGYVNGVYKVMGGADQPFRYGAYDEVMSSLAKVEAKNRGLTGWQKDNFIDDFIADPPKGAVEVAIKEAGDSTFQNKTALAAVVQSAVSGLKQRGHHKTAALVQSFAPFTGVPSSVADRVIRHTGIKAAKDIVKAIQAARKGEAWDQRELSRYIAEGTIGLPVVAAGFALAQADMFNGAYPTDPQERQKWTDQGRQENSVKINGEWHSLNYIQPFGVLLSIGAGIQQTKGKDGQDAAISDYLTNGAMGAMKSFMGQSYLEGLQGPIEAFSAPEQNLGGYISNTASSAVPNFIRSFARATDDVQRDTKGFVDGLAGSFPGTRQTLPEKLNSAGEPLPAKNNFFNQYVNPLKPSRVMDGNPVTEELTRLFDTGNGVTSSGMKTLKIDGTTHKLDKDQQREYNELLGKATYEKWAEIQKQDNYKNASDDDKASMLSNARTKINNELKEQYIKGETIDLSKSKGATIKPSSGGKSGSSTEIAPNLDKKSKDILAKYDSLDDAGRDKELRSRNEAEFEFAAAKYHNDKANGKLSEVEDIKARAKLAKLQAGSTYSKDVRELYELNKTQMTAYIQAGKLKEDQAKKIMEYGDKLAEAGLISKNKFRDTYGNESMTLKAKGGTRKASTGRKSSGGRKATGKGGKSTLPATDSTTSSLLGFAKTASNAAKSAKVAKKQLPTGTIRRPGIKAYKKPTKTTVSQRRTA